MRVAPGVADNTKKKKKIKPINVCVSAALAAEARGGIANNTKKIKPNKN